MQGRRFAPAGSHENILMAYYSRTGFTEKLMNEVKCRLAKRGHRIAVERLAVISENSCIGQIFKDIHHYPLIFFSSFNVSLRKRYVANYKQVEEAIAALQYPDVSGFDRICIGGPRWGQPS